MNQEMAMGILRHVINGLGATLVTGGYVSQGNWTTISAGLAMVLGTIAWSMYEKTRARMIGKVDAMPGVSGVVTADNTEGRQIAAAIPSPTVVAAGTRAAVSLAEGEVVSSKPQ